MVQHLKRSVICVNIIREGVPMMHTVFARAAIVEISLGQARKRFARFQRPRRRIVGQCIRKEG
jgi:hypothetical protein